MLGSVQNCGNWSVENRSAHCSAAFCLQGGKNCTDLALNVLYNLRLGTHMKFARRNNFLQPLALCPHRCCGSSPLSAKLLSNADKITLQKIWRNILGFENQVIRTLFEPQKNHHQSRFCLHGHRFRRCSLVPAASRSVSSRSTLSRLVLSRTSSRSAWSRSTSMRLVLVPLPRVLSPEFLFYVQ